uniref:Uncharacterized protein n=1 Tax=mine drainage metagenome TaxID=410659 RepID=E6PZH6_9ZZZZ
MESNMTCANMGWNMNVTAFGPITSTSQIANVASKIDLVPISGQSIYQYPRVPGVGKDHVVYVAPDFDDTLEFKD